MPTKKAVQMELDRKGFEQRVLKLSSLDGIFQKAANIIAGVELEGDYLEFGVARGAGLVAAYRTLKLAHDGQTRNIFTTPERRASRARIRRDCRFFGFDSFEGMPEITGIDAGFDFRKGQFACTLKEARAAILKAGVPAEKLHLVKGWYEDTLNARTAAQHQLKSAALVHIDCDLYESTKRAMTFVQPMLREGTVMVLDDWFCFNGNPDLGEQRAFYELKAEMPDWHFVEFQKDASFRNSFILSKRK